MYFNAAIANSKHEILWRIKNKVKQGKLLALNLCD